MVHRKTNERTPVTTKTNLFVLAGMLGVLIAVSTLVAILLISGVLEKPDPIISEDTYLEPEVIDIEEEEKYPLIDFQPVVDEFVNSTRGNRSVIVYDLENEQMVGEYNPAETYNTASLYKLFVVYEGYRRLENGTWNPEDIVNGAGFTISKCLDLAIRESKSECAEPLWQMIGHGELDSIIETDFDIHDSEISRLISNPQDILKAMKLFYFHEDITSPELIAQIKDSFLVQPTTTYNWRQGLPSGFTRANVYNKVGWDFNPNGNYWNIYHDAAIVEFPEVGRHYILVVMTNNVPYQKITDFGRNFEDYFYNNNQ